MFGLAAALLLAGIAVSEAASSMRLAFMIHAAFFSAETHQPKPIDPQVFVRDTAAPAAIGPQGIHHVAGARPAFIGQDAKTTPLVNANGKRLGFDLVQWLGAKGTVTITKLSDGKAKVAAAFTHLRPHGYYSLFENHFDEKPIRFTPLDGAGKTDNFIASKNGTARVTVIAPQMLTHANAILLVYHSDKTFHGVQRGEPGVTAHHQLIARVPE